MISIEGERIPMDTPVDTKASLVVEAVGLVCIFTFPNARPVYDTGYSYRQGEANGVERWLLKAEEMMRKSLASIVKEAFRVCEGCMARDER